jgi:hypothetical protein
MIYYKNRNISIARGTSGRISTVPASYEEPPGGLPRNIEKILKTHGMVQ